MVSASPPHTITNKTTGDTHTKRDPTHLPTHQNSLLTDFRKAGVHVVPELRVVHQRRDKGHGHAQRPQDEGCHLDLCGERGEEEEGWVGGWRNGGRNERHMSIPSIPSHCLRQPRRPRQRWVRLVVLLLLVVVGRGGMCRVEGLLCSGGAVWGGGRANAQAQASRH